MKEQIDTGTKLEWDRLLEIFYLQNAVHKLYYTVEYTWNHGSLFSKLRNHTGNISQVF